METNSILFAALLIDSEKLFVMILHCLRSFEKSRQEYKYPPYNTQALLNLKHFVSLYWY